MVKQVQIRRGTTVENDMYTGAQGELTMDTEKKELRLHDGTTQGGITFGDSVIEFQRPTAENNYTWYRKYASGWVEQGGLQTSATGSSGVTVTFPVAMADTNYTIVATVSGQQGYFVSCQSKTTTSFNFRSFNYNGEGYDRAGSWQVSGMAA